MPAFSMPAVGSKLASALAIIFAVLMRPCLIADLTFGYTPFCPLLSLAI